MSRKFDYSKVMPRYSVIAILFTLVSFAVIGKSAYIMTAQKDYWEKVASTQKKDSVPLKSDRGNILSCDGQLMASTIPTYEIFMDFQTLRETGNDSIWEANIDAIADGLHEIFPLKSSSDFKKHLEEGREKQSRHWKIWKTRIEYEQYKRVKELPVFSMSKYQSGFHEEEFVARKLPFGSLASRTVGSLYGSKDVARCGLEQYYDSILRGETGKGHTQKIRNKFLKITDYPAIHGSDIITTIDVNIQDLAERAVVDELKLINGNVGVAIVMEVATGDIKAIVNMEKKGNGEYGETMNHAVSDLLEPGSVFKTASLMVAIDDGVVDTNYVVQTGGGVWNMYGRDMKDHNWHKGGYGTITLPRSLEVSSNIGVSRIVDNFYHKNPEKFVEGIRNLGITDDFKIPIKGATPAKVRMPRKNDRGQYVNWSRTTLPWMSIGYETQVPPISTLTFYNAIANGGKMMRPRFVSKVVKDGKVIKEYPPVVQRDNIAKNKNTIPLMQTMLEHVVSQGLGKQAGSKSFKVAGKTGTAQISKGAAGYHSGVVDYLLSFAGYFPADAPRYSCIVCIQKTGLPASGGGMSGVVFHNIAEGIMSQSLKLDVNDACDSLSARPPLVKAGNLLAADYVLNSFGFNVINGWNGSYKYGNPIWGIAEEKDNKTVRLVKQAVSSKKVMPNIVGMGARDAVYLLEKHGVKVRIMGRGKVKEQSIKPGTTLRKGMICSLTMA